MLLSENSADEVFILRLWREAVGSAADFQWRALVTHLNSGDRRTANSIEDAFGLVRARLERAVPGEEMEAS